jgi:hypothetical protein
MSDTITVTVPPRFYWDHVERDCSEGVIVKRTKKALTIMFTHEELRDFYTDAEHYSHSWQFGNDPWMRGLCNSAKATFKALNEQVEWIEQES